MAEGGDLQHPNPHMEAHKLVQEISALLANPVLQSTVNAHKASTSFNILHNSQHGSQSSPPLQQSDLQPDVNNVPQADNAPQIVAVDLNMTINTLCNKLDQLLAEKSYVSQQKPNSQKERVVLPEIFKGGPNDDWQDYISMFEMYSKINNWDENEKGLYLATRMRGEAQRIVTDLSDSDRSSYEKLKAALSKRFCPLEKASLMQVEFKNRKRKKGEELSDLLLDLKRLARLAYPNFKEEVLEQLIADRFLDVLESRDLKRHIHLNRITKVDKILEVALEYEAFECAENSSKPQKVGSTSVSQQSDEKLNRLIDLTDQLYRQMGVLTEKFAKLLNNSNDDRPEFLGVPVNHDPDNTQPPQFSNVRGRGQFRGRGGPRDRALSRGRGNYRNYQQQGN